MKIAISCFATIGGSGILATELGIGLANRGHEIHFINYERPVYLNNLSQNIHFHPIDVFHYQSLNHSPNDIALISKMIDIISTLNIDILHTHYIVPHTINAYFAYLLSNTKHVKIVASMHGTDITQLAKDPIYCNIMKHVLERVDGLTAVSNFLKNKCYETLNLSRDIKVIHNFVDVGQLKPQKIKKYKEKIVLHLSNMRSVKRVADVINTFNLVQNQIESRLLMVGEGPELDNAKTLCKQLGLSDKIDFLGNLSDKNYIFNCADVFLLPSESEGFSLASLEAMACGVPCVVTNQGGTTELIRDGIDGFLVQPGNIEELASKILLLLGNDQLRLTMGESARQRAVDNFSMECMIDQYEQLFYKLLK